MILGVSFDTVEENKAFAEKFSFPFLLLCDTEREVGLAYGAADHDKSPAAKRISYLIGPDGQIKHAYKKVNVATHPGEVLEHIAELG